MQVCILKGVCTQIWFPQFKYKNILKQLLGLRIVFVPNINQIQRDNDSSKFINPLSIKLVKIINLS